METPQVSPNTQPRRGDRDGRTNDVCDATAPPDVRAANKAFCEEKRAEYLRLHDDDEAELELPR